jgi:hypothetical protein
MIVLTKIILTYTTKCFTQGQMSSFEEATTEQLGLKLSPIGSYTAAAVNDYADEEFVQGSPLPQDLDHDDLADGDCNACDLYEQWLF